MDEALNENLVEPSTEIGRPGQAERPLGEQQQSHAQGELQLRSRLAQLAEAEERIRSVVDHVVDGIITIDDRGIIQSVNPAAEKIFGYSAGELIGRNVHVLMPEPYRSEHQGYIENYVHTGVARIIGIGREVVGLRRDGTTFPMELGVSEFHLGSQRYFTGIVRDISERKRAENVARFIADVSRSLASLVDSESTMQKVAHLAVPFFADWCVVHMSETRGQLRQVAVAHADPAKVKLIEELAGREPSALDAILGASRVFHGGEAMLQAEISDAVLEQAVRDEQHLETLRQLSLRSCISAPLTVRATTFGTISLVLAGSRRPFDSGDLAVAKDLAQRAAVAIENARLYSQVRDAGRRKDDFLAMLAHELRNPLVPIRSGLDLLATSGTESDIVGLMQRQVEHLVRLVDDLLDVSRILRGKIELRRQVQELSPIVERVVETTRLLIQSQRHQLTVTLPPKPIWVDVDPVRLAQVIANLLNNAVKYTEPTGQIWLTVKQQGPWAVLRVRDTGIGISEQLLPQIFDPFVQADHSLERSQGGLGIGLALVRSLIELHGGTVQAVSEGEGKGSEFVVRLAVHRKVKKQPAQPVRKHPIPSRRILIVDDNVSAANMLGMLLSRLGSHEVWVVHDGRSALEKAALVKPEIVLLDIGLPRMNGYEVAKRLRQQPDLAKAVLVALTGYGTESDRQRSLDAGFDEHVVKPPSVDSLRQLTMHPRLSQEEQ